MKKVYLLLYWSDKEQRNYLAAAFKNRENAKDLCKSFNTDWEGLGRTYHIETIQIWDE